MIINCPGSSPDQCPRHCVILYLLRSLPGQGKRECLSSQKGVEAWQVEGSSPPLFSLVPRLVSILHIDHPLHTFVVNTVAVTACLLISLLFPVNCSQLVIFTCCASTSQLHPQRRKEEGKAGSKQETPGLGESHWGSHWTGECHS